MAAPVRHVALLRGINVGGNKRIAMADLRGLVEDLGHTDVSTLLQSGNVVYTAAAGSSAASNAAALHDAIATELGLDVAVVVRTRAEIAAVRKRDPLHDVAVDPSRYLVTFMAAKPTAAQVRAFDGDAFPPERAVIAGGELYQWCPDGIHLSRLSKSWSAATGNAVGTARNWNTVGKIGDLLDG